jgi:hypothetical protein
VTEEDKIRQELLQNTVTGQVATIVFDEDHDDKGLPLSSYSSNSLSNVGCFKNCCTLKGILMIGFGVLIVVVASILVSHKETTVYRDREEDDKEGEGGALLTVVPSTLPSTYPSVAPSINIVNLDNRLLDQAHPLTLHSNNGPLKASLSTAIDQQVQSDCGAKELTLPGLWYTYQAQLSGPVTIVTCGPAVTTMNVFQYIDTDDDTTTTTRTTTTGGRTVLSCLLTYFQNGDVGQCGGDPISWNADQDQVYFVLMSPKLVDVNGANSTNGTMTLTTTTNVTMANDNEVDNEDEDEESDMLFTIQIVDHDQCAYAFGWAKPPNFLVGALPLIPTTVESVLSYTTIHATPDTDVVSSLCGGALTSASLGVWYLLQGDGHAYTVSTCASTTNITTTTTTTTTLLDTQISVFRGDDCNSLTCVNGNNDYCGLQSTVVWQTTAGDTYYILVHGLYPNSTGTFTLIIAVDTP